MNGLARWWKFNLVGLIGFGLQMTVLFLLRRVCGTHYLLATAVALELTLVHNFIWHLHYTWRDRPASSKRMQFARFQLSNGMVSLVGNLLLVRVLVGATHLPLLAANAIAILCCAVANFYLGDLWAFANKCDGLAGEAGSFGGPVGSNLNLAHIKHIARAREFLMNCAALGTDALTDKKPPSGRGF